MTAPVSGGLADWNLTEMIFGSEEEEQGGSGVTNTPGRQGPH